MDYDDITTMLFRARRSAGLTQREIADRVGVSPAAVGNWEQGLNRVPSAQLAALAKAVGFELLCLPAQSADPRLLLLVRGFLDASPEIQEAILRILDVCDETERKARGA